MLEDVGSVELPPLVFGRKQRVRNDVFRSLLEQRWRTRKRRLETIGHLAGFALSLWRGRAARYRTFAAIVSRRPCGTDRTHGKMRYGRLRWLPGPR
jgi:hypothetical protein